MKRVVYKKNGSVSIHNFSCQWQQINRRILKFDKKTAYRAFGRPVGGKTRAESVRLVFVTFTEHALCFLFIFLYL